jgi:hypothetical protein
VYLIQKHRLNLQFSAPETLFYTSFYIHCFVHWGRKNITQLTCCILLTKNYVLIGKNAFCFFLILMQDSFPCHQSLFHMQKHDQEQKYIMFAALSINKAPHFAGITILKFSHQLTEVRQWQVSMWQPLSMTFPM